MGMGSGLSEDCLMPSTFPCYSQALDDELLNTIELLMEAYSCLSRW